MSACLSHFPHYESDPFALVPVHTLIATYHMTYILHAAALNYIRLLLLQQAYEVMTMTILTMMTMTILMMVMIQYVQSVTVSIRS